MSTTGGRMALDIAGYTSEVASWAVVLPAQGILGRQDPTQCGDQIDLDPRAILGRKGLRYLSPASVIAGCAATLALAGLPETPSARTGIVAGSQFGHLAAVCRSAERFATGRAIDVSPMDLPNASMNVVAATLAMRHHITGVCLTLDSGAHVGRDVLVWAHRLLRSGRCDRVLAVLAEEPSAHDMPFRASGAALLRGAVAIVLGPGTGAGGQLPGQTADAWWAEGESGSLGPALDVVARVAAWEHAERLSVVSA